MFINNFNTGFNILGLNIKYYGLVYAIGFLITYFLLIQIAKKKLIKNFTEKKAEDYIFWFMIFVIIGARLIHVLIWNPVYYFHNPLQIFAIWRGGLAFHGGLLGAIVYSIYFCKKNNVSFFKLGDLLVLPLAFFLVFGRIANFINGELWGIPYDGRFCVAFPKAPDGGTICRHPYTIYASLKNLLVFVILSILLFHKKLKNKLKDGIIFSLFIILYSSGRIFVDLYRENAFTGHVLNIIMLIIGITILIYLKKCKKSQK